MDSGSTVEYQQGLRRSLAFLLLLRPLLRLPLLHPVGGAVGTPLGISVFVSCPPIRYLLKRTCSSDSPLV